MQVRTKDGKPYKVLMHKQWHPISQRIKRWRIDEGWWADAKSRMYWKARLKDGHIVVVFEDLLTGKWYEQKE